MCLHGPWSQLGRQQAASTSRCFPLIFFHGQLCFSKSLKGLVPLPLEPLLLGLPVTSKESP